MPSPFRLLLLGLFGVLALRPAVAETFKDATFGLTAEIPEGYKLEQRQLAQAVSLYMTKPNTEAFCSVLYIAGQRLPGTQAQINERAKPVLDGFIVDTRKDAVVSAVAPFVVGDVEGIALEAIRDRPGPRGKLHFSMAYLETTRGHAQFVCAASWEAFAAVKPAFDRLFRSIHLP